MKIRLLTTDNYIDIEIKNCDEPQLLAAIDEGNAIALTKNDGNTLIINTINIVAIEIIKEDSPLLNIE